MLRVAVEKIGAVAIVRCRGRICFGEPLKELRDAVLCHNSRVVKIDLSQVMRIDAAGLGVIAFLCSMSYAAGIDFALVNPTPRVRDLLEMVRFAGMVETTPLLIPRTRGEQDETSGLPESRRAAGWMF
jgi:anti-anti-sigma factor